MVMITASPSSVLHRPYAPPPPSPPLLALSIQLFPCVLTDPPPSSFPLAPRFLSLALSCVYQPTPRLLQLTDTTFKEASCTLMHLRT
jgi:hypothetical protein